MTIRAANRLPRLSTLWVDYDEVLIIDPMPPFTREEYERDF